MDNLKVQETLDFVEVFVSQVENAIIEGEIDPLQYLIHARKLKDVLESSLKNSKVKESIQDEFNKYPEKVVEVGEWEISERQGAPIYELESDEELAILKEKVKNREDLLKLAAKNVGKMVVVDPNSGEVVEPPRIKGYRANSMVVTRKKKK